MRFLSENGIKKHFRANCYIVSFFYSFALCLYLGCVLRSRDYG